MLAGYTNNKQLQIFTVQTQQKFEITTYNNGYNLFDPCHLTTTKSVIERMEQRERDSKRNH